MTASPGRTTGGVAPPEQSAAGTLLPLDLFRTLRDAGVEQVASRLDELLCLARDAELECERVSPDSMAHAVALLARQPKLACADIVVSSEGLLSFDLDGPEGCFAVLTVHESGLIVFAARRPSANEDEPYRLKGALPVDEAALALSPFFPGRDS